MGHEKYMTTNKIVCSQRDAFQNQVCGYLSTLSVPLNLGLFQRRFGAGAATGRLLVSSEDLAVVHALSHVQIHPYQANRLISTEPTESTDSTE